MIGFETFDVALQKEGFTTIPLHGRRRPCVIRQEQRTWCENALTNCFVNTPCWTNED